MEEAPAAEARPPQWKLPTPALLLMLIVAVLVAVSLCISTVLKKKQASSAQNRQAAGQQYLPDPAGKLPSDMKNVTSPKRNEVLELLRSLIKRLLVGSGSSCWSRSREDDDSLHLHRHDYNHETCTGGDAEQQAPLGGVWDMPTPARTVAASPLWGRRILMGGRCQMPRFSGLILYDEKGMPLRNNSGIHAQDKLKAAGITTLRDLL